MSWRVLLAFTLLGALVAAIALLGQGAAGPQGTGGSQDGAGPSTASPLTVDASTCQVCHPEIYAQWEGSQHHHAYLNPDVRETSADHRNQNCIPCHAPRPISELGLDTMPRSRGTHREQGVSCLSCHLIPGSTTADGVARLAGSRDLPLGVCGLEVVKTPALGTYRSCEPCHNQHETTNQWKETSYAQEGPAYRSCADCHMTRREFTVAKGSTPRVAWDHAMPGSHDRDFILSALDIVAELDGDALRVAITNARAGHHFPTEERSRAVDVMVEWQDGEGRSLGEAVRLYRFRDPYRGEQGIVRTLLPQGQTWSQSVAKGERPAAAKKARVWVDYLRKPYDPVPDSHRYRLFERTVELP